MSLKITVSDFVESGTFDEASGLYLYHGQRVFLATYLGDLLVGHVRWFPRDPWAVCPKANGGFGASFMVCKNTPLILEADPALSSNRQAELRAEGRI